MNKRIHDSLHHVFNQHRIVFWYDSSGEWLDTFNSFDDGKVVKLKVEGNEFGTKVKVLSTPNTEYLIYVPTARPEDADNWLLDLLLKGYEYRADKASLALQDVGLPHEFAHIYQDHENFFRDDRRNKALKELLSKDDRTSEIQLKMMAVLANTDADIDSILLSFLKKYAESESIDPVNLILGSSALVTPFWKQIERAFGYSSNNPGLRDFTITLFRDANPLDKQVTLNPHAKVFLKSYWHDSNTYSPSFKNISQQLEKDLHIKQSLESLDERTSLGDSDIYEIFDKFTLYRLCQAFEKDAPPSELRMVIQQRRNSFWYKDHEHGYRAVENALELREFLANAELSMDSLETGVNRYVNNWWRIDKAYRRCIWSLQRYGNSAVMEPIKKWVEKTYVNNFLLTLTDRFSDHTRKLESWNCSGITSQRRFFYNYVEPFLHKKQKVCVIISDALRYEAAMEFADRLQSTNRWTADVDPMFGSLPTYTQLGMASLLPGQKFEVNPDNATVSIDGKSASGTLNRSEILRAACKSRAIAIKAEEFLKLNSKTEGRALMRDNDVTYIFHNRIDKVGDSRDSEGKTFDAVEHTFDELEQILKKVASINWSNMLLTADHGFIFQQTEVDDNDMIRHPDATKITYENRRFLLGKNITENSKIKVFNAKALGLEGDWDAAFPLSLGRFPLKGSGKRFVHGGLSLQEIIVPVVKIRKNRADDTGMVEVELLRAPTRITTGQVSIALYQDQPAIEKILPRTLRIGVFSKDGKELSEIKTLKFDSKETEARNRESTLTLTLSRTADDYNNREVEIRILETVSGAHQTVVYKSHSLKLQKPFASDFDEF